MTCKDCIHYIVCKRIDYELEYHNKSIKEAEEQLAKKCYLFKNKSNVQEIIHGKWKVVYQNKVATVYECSICGHLDFGTSDYCICGAKMDGKDE